MVIYDLICVFGHSFEGWFANATAYQAQQTDQLLSCPVCQCPDVTKRPSAPHLKPSVSSQQDAVAESSDAVAAFDREHGPSGGKGAALPHNATQPSSGRVANPRDASSTGSRHHAEEQKRLYLEYQSALKTVHEYIEHNFDDVGAKFTEKAIAMHNGELDLKNIRGTATTKQTQELHERGVITLALPPKPIDKNKLN